MPFILKFFIKIKESTLMSDCRKFSSTDANLSPEDRLSELERKFLTILERIKAYDEVLDKFKTLTEKFNQVQRNIQEVQTDQTKTSQDMVSFHDSLSFRLDRSNKYIEDHERKCEEQFHDLKELYVTRLADLTNIKKQQEKFEEKANKTFESLATKKEIEVFKDESTEAHKNLNDQFVESNEIVNYVSESYNDLKTLHEEQSDKIHCINNLILNFVSERKIKNNEWETKFNRMVAIIETYATKKDIESAVKTLRNDLEGSPSSLEATKAEIIKKFEIASLDASNSVLKANNCVKQIELIERKIENLSLIVKKHELSK